MRSGLGPQGLVLLAAVFASAPAFAGDDEGWKQTMQDSQMTVWQKDVPGSSVKAIKAAGVIDAPPAAVFAVLRDFEHYSDIMPYVTKETKVLETAPDGKAVWYYTVVDAPIVSKRDYTLKVSIEKVSENGDGVYKLTWTAANDHAQAPKPRDGYVRLNNSTGSWELKPFGDGKTFAVYHINADPGGSLPSFVVNKANSEAVPKVYESLRKFAKKAPYNAAK